MKTDKELIELAAKAAGYNIKWRDMKGGYERALITPKLNGKWWNPIADDGDAFRLAVKLCLVVTVGSKNVEARRWAGADDEQIGLFCRIESQGDDPLSATRRAIVRTAAAIGESK
jgi:hypothetical protein